MVVSVRTSIAKQIKKQQHSSKKLSVRQARIRADRKYYRNPENQKTLVSAFIGDLAEATFSPETFSYRWNQKFGNLIKSLQPKMPNGRRKSIGMHAAYENPRYRRMFNVLMHRDPEAEVEWEAFRRYFLNGVVKDMILDRPLPARVVNTLSPERKKRVRRAVRKMDTSVRAAGDQAEIRPVREERASDTREERVPRGAVSFEAVEMENGAAVASNRSDDKVPEEPLPATERAASHPGVDINLMDPAVMEAERRRNWRGVDINLMEPERDEEAEELEALLRSSMVSGRPDKRDEQAVEVHEPEKEAVENEAAGKGVDSVSDNQSEKVVEEVSAPAADPVTAEREEPVSETVFRMSEPNSEGVTITVPDHGLGGWEAVMPEDTPVAETAGNSDRESVSAVARDEAPEKHAESTRQPENETVQPQEETAADRAARWEAERSQKRTAVNAGIKQPENSENAKSRRSFRFGATLMRNPVIRNLVMVAALAGTITGAQVLRNHLEAPVSRADTVLVDHHNNDVREIVENGAQKDRGVVETKTASKPTVAVEKESVVTDTVVKAASQQDSAPSVQPVTQDVSKEPVVSQQNNAPSAGAENAENGSENKSEEAVKKPETKSEGTPGATTSGENEMPIAADNNADTPVYTLEDIQNVGSGVVMTEEAPYQVQVEDVSETAVAEKATAPEAESETAVKNVSAEQETVTVSADNDVDTPVYTLEDIQNAGSGVVMAEEAPYQVQIEDVPETAVAEKATVPEAESETAVKNVSAEQETVTVSADNNADTPVYTLEDIQNAGSGVVMAEEAPYQVQIEDVPETAVAEKATAPEAESKVSMDGKETVEKGEVDQPSTATGDQIYGDQEQFSAQELIAIHDAAVDNVAKTHFFGRFSVKKDEVRVEMARMLDSGEADKVVQQYRLDHAEEIAAAQAEAAKAAAEKAAAEQSGEGKATEEQATAENSKGLFDSVGEWYDGATARKDGSNGIVSSFNKDVVQPALNGSIPEYTAAQKLQQAEDAAVREAAADHVAEKLVFGHTFVTKEEVQAEMARMAESGEAQKIRDEFRKQHAEEIAAAQAEAAKAAAEKAAAEQSGEGKATEEQATAENSKGLFDSVGEWYDGVTARKDGSNGIVSSFNKDVVQPALNGSIPEYTAAQKLQQAEDAAVREAAADHVAEKLVFGHTFATKEEVQAEMARMAESGEAQKIRDEFRKQHAEEIAAAQAEAAKAAAEKAAAEQSGEGKATEEQATAENDKGLFDSIGEWYDGATARKDGSNGIVSSFNKDVVQPALNGSIPEYTAAQKLQQAEDAAVREAAAEKAKEDLTTTQKVFGFGTAAFQTQDQVDARLSEMEKSGEAQKIRDEFRKQHAEEIAAAQAEAAKAAAEKAAAEKAAAEKVSETENESGGLLGLLQRGANWVGSSYDQATTYTAPDGSQKSGIVSSAKDHLSAMGESETEKLPQTKGELAKQLNEGHYINRTVLKNRTPGSASGR